MGNRWARLALGIWSVGLGACATAGAGNTPPAREATAAGPALPAHVERAHRRALERCLALPVAGVDGATLEFPSSMLDGVDETAAPRSAEQLRREIAHLDATLEAAGASGERASALYQSARLWAELGRGLDGEAAAAAQRESLTRYQQVLEDGAGRVLTPLAQLAVGRLQLALGDVASARAAFLAIGRNEPPHLSAAAAANLERLAELEGDREAALAVRAEAPRAEQERRSWRRTVSTLNALLHYRQAWLLRLGGDEAGALAAFDRVDDVVARDNPHLGSTREPSTPSRLSFCTAETRRHAPPRIHARAIEVLASLLLPPRRDAEARFATEARGSHRGPRLSVLSAAGTWSRAATG